MAKQEAIEEAKNNVLIKLKSLQALTQEWHSDLMERTYDDYYEFLYWKAIFTACLLHELPFGIKHCPFCIETIEFLAPDCSKCSYATTHDKCTKEISIYKILDNALTLVEKILLSLYAVEKPKQEDINKVCFLVDKVRDQLTYWKYRNLLAKKGKTGEK